jgi:hypothetical protein
MVTTGSAEWNRQRNIKLDKVVKAEPVNADLEKRVEELVKELILKKSLVDENKKLEKLNAKLYKHIENQSNFHKLLEEAMREDKAEIKRLQALNGCRILIIILPWLLLVLSKIF